MASLAFWCSSTSDVPTVCFFFFLAEDGIRGRTVTGVQPCALPISGCCATGRRCSGRWLPCRRRGGCWTGSMSRTWSGCGRRGPLPGNGRGSLGRPQNRAPSCGSTSTPRSASRSARKRTRQPRGRRRSASIRCWRSPTGPRWPAVRRWRGCCGPATQAATPLPILRKERPHPGAQLTFTDVDGHRVTAFLTDTGRGVIPGQIAGLELRHRQHARVEDRIREGKATGLRNLPCRGWDQNSAWLEAVLAAADLICWAKLICFAHVPSLARCEIAAFRYRVLHVAAQLTRSARRTCLRIDRTWRWAAQIAEGFHRLRAAFA